MNNKTVIAFAIITALMPVKAIALSERRWEAVNAHYHEADGLNNGPLNVGDSCFVVKDDMAAMSMSALPRWKDQLNKQLLTLADGLIPDTNFFDSVATSSNGEFVKLDKGSTVRIVDGNYDSQLKGFTGGIGKIEILTGSNSGKVCYYSGLQLRKRFLDKPDDFFETEEERKASEALFLNKELSMKLPDALRRKGVEIEVSSSSTSTPTGFTRRGNSAPEPKNAAAMTENNENPTVKISMSYGVMTAEAFPDEGAYMGDLYRRVKRAWFPPPGNMPITVEVSFTVHKDGQKTRLRVASSSGLRIVDSAALKAVENASPFRPFPGMFPDELTIKFTFDYNPVKENSGGVFRQF